MHFSKHLHGARCRDAVGIAVVGSVLLFLASAGPALAGTPYSGSHASARSKSAPHAPGKPKSAKHAPGKSPVSSATPSSWADYYVVLMHASGHGQIIYELTVKWLNVDDFGLDVFQLGEQGVVPPGASAVQPGWILVLPASGSSPADPAAGTSANPPAVPAPGGWASHYTIKTVGHGSNAVQYELMVKAQDDGDLSLDIFQLVGGGSQQVRTGVIQPSWVLVLPANGSAPMTPVGPLAAVTQTSGATQTGGATIQSSGQRTRHVVVGAAQTYSAGRAWAASGTGIAVIIALLLTVWLLYRRSGRNGGPRAVAPSPPTAVNNPVGGPGGTAPIPLRPVSRLDVVSLPDEFVPVQPQLVATAGSGAAGRDTAGAVPGLTSVALRMLTAQRRDGSWDETPDVPVQRLRVVSGGDQIEVALAKVPAVGHDDEPDAGSAGSPHLVWAPLPYDIPGNGGAFACLGTGDEGCLFLDLAAAPGMVALGGDRAAATRLAESIAHQLSMPGDARRRLALTVVGDAVPEPLPAGVTRVAAIADLGQGGADHTTRVIFCRLHSNQEAYALIRHIAAGQPNVIPVVLADMRRAPWSFTAQSGLLSRPVVGQVAEARP
jgi:hypothetical protein